MIRHGKSVKTLTATNSAFGDLIFLIPIHYSSFIFFSAAVIFILIPSFTSSLSGDAGRTTMPALCEPPIAPHLKCLQIMRLSGQPPSSVVSSAILHRAARATSSPQKLQIDLLPLVSPPNVPSRFPVPAHSGPLIFLQRSSTADPTVAVAEILLAAFCAKCQRPGMFPSRRSGGNIKGTH